jgi:hypothetical protein
MKIKLNSISFMKIQIIIQKIDIWHKIEISFKFMTFIWNIFQYAEYLMKYIRKNNFWLCALWYL